MLLYSAKYRPATNIALHGITEILGNTFADGEVDWTTRIGLQELDYKNWTTRIGLQELDFNDFIDQAIRRWS